MAGDIEAIEKVVWTYLDGLYEGDTGKLGKAFHEVSHLYSMHEGGVADVPRANWFDLVNSRPSAKQGVCRAPTASFPSTCPARRRPSSSWSARCRPATSPTT